MGSGASQERDHANQIDKQIRVEARILRNEWKVLLLGSGECGKSTLLKQMKIIHLDGFTTQECLHQIPAMHRNLVDGMADTVHFCRAQQLPIADEFMPLANEVCVPSAELTPALADAILRLAQDKSIQQAIRRGNEYHLIDQFTYFLGRATVMAAPDFLPSTEDMLCQRVRSTGIRDITFSNASGVRFRMVDVGGQRSERKKWISHFDDVNGIFFVASLSDYNQNLFEDDKTNRMKEAIALFAQTANCEFFLNTSFILFLNKDDIFRQKLPLVPLNTCFASFTEPNEYENAVSFIRDRFFSVVNNHTTRKVYSHVTTATSTSNIKFVFEVVSDVLVRAALKTSGLLL